MLTDTETRPTYSDIRHAMRQYAELMHSKPGGPTEPDQRGFFTITQLLPPPDFSAAYRREKATNTPFYQEVVQETRNLIDAKRAEIETCQVLPEPTLSLRGSQRTFRQMLRGMVSTAARIVRR